MFANHLWQLVKMPIIPPMGGEPMWTIDWGCFGQAYESEHPDVIGFERADMFEAMLILRGIENEAAEDQLLAESVG